MGRPVRYGGGELSGFEERARAMIAHRRERAGADRPRAEAGLQALRRARAGRHRAHRRAVELSLSHGGQFGRARADGRQCRAAEARRADAAGRRSLPGRRWTAPACRRACSARSTLSHDDTTKLIGSGAVDQICFTGSVAAGKAIERAAAGTFAGVGLELGGKDPAYVRPDVDLAARGREHRRRRLLQFRPMLLRHRARLRACRRLRQVRRRVSST